MTKVIVLAGGTSDEREISLRSGAAVAKALAFAGYEVEMLDPADGLESLLPRLKKATLVFPALHGSGGEDGALQKFLDDHGIKYVGSGHRASALCFDKATYTELLDKEGISVPRTEKVTIERFRRSALIKQPFVLKPNDGGSSIDTLIVRDPSHHQSAAVEQAFSLHRMMLLQELIAGVEITVAVIGNETLPIIEIIPPQGGEFDYENKYNGQTQELCPPKHVNQSTQKHAQELALLIHHLTGCRDLSRTDMIITQDEELYVLETNTIPGLTEASLVPKAAAERGLSMPALCSRLIEAALDTTG